MNTQHELFEKRAGIYWWFSTLLIREMDHEQVAALTGKPGIEFFDAFAAEGMNKEVDELQSALERLESNGELRLELAADYAQTFLRDGKNSALPYASVYRSRDGLLYQQAQKEMTELLQRKGLALDETLGEPADHIAVQLDFMGNLILSGINASDNNQLQEGLNEQLAFINDQLMNWIPQLVEKSQHIQDALFYPALCRLLLVYLQKERDFLIAEGAQS